MKKLQIIIMLMAMALIACDQDRDQVPAEVSAAFDKMFPTATEVEWEADEQEFEAEFEFGGQEHVVSFNKNGEWQETERAINPKELSELIKSNVAEAYPDYEIDEALTIETPDFEGYELVLEKGDEEIEILSTFAGELSMEQEEGKDTDDEEEDDGEDDDDDEDEDEN